MSASYDRALTIFSPDGHLFQVEYAMEAVKKGAATVGVMAGDVVVLAVEKRSPPKLQDPRTVRKIVPLDGHISLAFSGLAADARALIDQARVAAQSHRLTVEVAPTVEYVARAVAGVQQQYTQRGGRRPFGVTSLIAGHDPDGTPRLMQCDPTGICSSWRASAAGNEGKALLEFLEKNYTDGLAEEDAVKLAMKTLLEVTESGSGHMEVCVMRHGSGAETLPAERVDALTAEIAAEAEAAQ